MALIDIWQSSQEELKEKHLQQIIAIAGNGKLLDGNVTSTEFRKFLSLVPSQLLGRYANNCLNETFSDSGFALQDIVNQVGSRLGFSTTEGRYRGTSSHIGFDGLWNFPNGHAVIVEVKTTDAYRIDLNRIASYRNDLIINETVGEYKSSILIVVGRQDTGDVEAQIRGSRHAWDVRLISVDALLRLMAVKEEVEDPTIVQRIYDILIPKEFTRLDDIVNILFSTAENIKQEEAPAGEAEEEDDEIYKPKFTPVAFHEACVARIEKHLNQNLLRRSRATFSTPDDVIGLICAVSKEHVSRGQTTYWFAFHPHQKEFLEHSKTAYVAFGCGSVEKIILIPFADFAPWLDGMNITELADKRFYWHVSIFLENGSVVLHRKRGEPRIDLMPYVLAEN